MHERKEGCQFFDMNCGSHQSNPNFFALRAPYKGWGVIKVLFKTPKFFLIEGGVYYRGRLLDDGWYCNFNESTS